HIRSPRFGTLTVRRTKRLVPASGPPARFLVYPASVHHPSQAPIGVITTPLPERGGRAPGPTARDFPRHVIDASPGKARPGFLPLQIIVFIDGFWGVRSVPAVYAQPRRICAYNGLIYIG